MGQLDYGIMSTHDVVVKERMKIYIDWLIWWYYRSIYIWSGHHVGTSI